MLINVMITGSGESDFAFSPDISPSAHSFTGFSRITQALLGISNRAKLGCAMYEEVGMNHRPTKALCMEFLTVIAVLTVIGVISANRSSAGPIVRWGTTFFFLVMQAIGGGVALPIYFCFIVYNGSQSARASFVPSGWARSLLPAIMVGYFLPCVTMLLPTLFTQRQQDVGLAIWQAFPAYVSLIAAILAVIFTGSGLVAMSTSDAMVSTTLIISTMDFMVLASIIGHVYAIYIAYSDGMTLASFIPEVNLTTPEHVSHAFLTFDFLACMIALWTLIFYDTTRFAGVGKTSITVSVLISVLGTVVLGPGGAAAWAWSNIEKARLGALVADRPKKTVAVESVPASQH
ncbi:hypothetical protein MRB53_040533 [Persea americana]|nr:hypothetical protein MRB53_040533 [Persea americana]